MAPLFPFARLHAESVHACCGGGRYHGVMWAVVHSAPLSVVNSYLLSFHQLLRSKYYKKLEREAKAAKKA